MAFTAGYGPATLRALARAHRQPAPEKQNVPPFRGGTREPLYACADNSQPVRRSLTQPDHIAVPRKNQIAMLR
jgi:hypothetical protein